MTINDKRLHLHRVDTAEEAKLFQFIFSVCDNLNFEEDVKEILEACDPIVRCILEYIISEAEEGKGEERPNLASTVRRWGRERKFVTARNVITTACRSIRLLSTRLPGTQRSHENLVAMSALKRSMTRHVLLSC